MNSAELCTTAPFPTSRGERLTRDPHFAGSWRPLSTDPAVIVPVHGSPARRTR
jgi:hypothetical protein